MVKRLPEGESHATMLAYFCLMSLALTVVPAAVRWTPPSASQWLLLAGVGSLGVVSQAMIIRAYRSGEASFVAPFDYLKLILAGLIGFRSEEHTSELQSLMRISYAVFCLKKKNTQEIK